MEIRFTRAARKHRISRADAIHALSTCTKLLSGTPRPNGEPVYVAIGNVGGRDRHRGRRRDHHPRHESTDEVELIMPISEKDAAALAAMIENEEIEFTELPRDDWPEVLKRGRGRPALSCAGNAGERSPQVTVRLPQDLMERARQRAEREGVSLSELTREAMKEYLAS